MRFDGIGPVPNSQSLDPAGSSGYLSSKGRAGQTKAASDETQLSASKSRVQDLKAQLTPLPDVRQDRVATLQKAIQNGNFHVTDQQLADAILGDFFGPVTTGNR